MYRLWTFILTIVSLLFGESGPGLTSMSIPNRSNMRHKYRVSVVLLVSSVTLSNDVGVQVL